jgi:hypothetical protein
VLEAAVPFFPAGSIHLVVVDPGVGTDRRVQHFLESDRAGWYNHVNLTAHDHGGHFIPWEIPDEWVEDLRRTLRFKE